MKKHFTKEEVFDLTEDNTVEYLGGKPFKHGSVLETYIILHDNIHWKLSFIRTENEGWLIDNGIDAVEVKSQEKTVIEWVEVE